MKQTDIITYFNKNYNTNDSLIIKALNNYIHSSHRYVSLKIDGYLFTKQPSWPDKTVKTYRVYYDNTMQYAHESGRIVLTFTDDTTTEIGLYKFKRFLRKSLNLDTMGLCIS